jgi:hypothetical protein
MVRVKIDSDPSSRWTSKALFKISSADFAAQAGDSTPAYKQLIDSKKHLALIMTSVS